LLGDASYDYKNRLANKHNFVPIYQSVASFSLYSSYCLDDFIGYLDPNEGANFTSQGLDIGIGRLPVISLEEAQEQVDKIMGYATAYGAPKMICLDVANGYTMQFLDCVSTLRDIFPESFIMAGNVVTPEKTEQVVLAGADCVKVGIGPGSVCTTRKMTGVGYPQLSAIIECAAAAHGVGGLVCGDGGCVYPGDVSKAFGAGADFVMLGGMLSGTTETSGDVVELNGSKFKRFYGMSSKVANDTYAGGLNGYRAAEGKEVLVPFKGPVGDVLSEIIGGVRSTMTYVGATKLKELTKRTKFVRVNHQINNSFSGYEV
jgi:GMP reductase